MNCWDSMAWRINTLVLSLLTCIRLMEGADDDLTSNLSRLSCNKSTCRHSAMINEWWVPFHVPGCNEMCWGRSSFSFRVSVRTPRPGLASNTDFPHGLLNSCMFISKIYVNSDVSVLGLLVSWISGSWRENTYLFSPASLWFTALVDPQLAYVNDKAWQVRFHCDEWTPSAARRITYSCSFPPYI